MNNRRGALWFYAGVFVLCMSTLMLQVIQTRILSVMSFYYMAFLSIGMAMFGLTTGALLVFFDGFRFEGRPIFENLRWTCLAFAVAIAVCFAIQLTSVTITILSATFVLLWLKLVILLAVPFVFAGAAVSYALTRSPYPLNIVYGVDLLGAACGCLCVIAVLDVMDAPSATFLVASMAALAGLCFGRAEFGSSGEASLRHGKVSGRWTRPGWVAVALLCLSVLNSLSRYGFQPIGGKFGIENRSDFDFEEWNSFSRVVISKSNPSLPFLWGPSPTYRAERRVEQRILDIDGFAGTAMPRFDGDTQSVSFLAQDITNLVYTVRNRGRCAVIGVGSGRDLLSAHLFGCRDITGIEINPIFVDYLQSPNKLRGYAGVADLPGVRFVVDDGRSWLARTQDRFDVIEMSMIDTFAATGVGAFSLSENGLYTIEGWRTFLEALTPTGMLTVSRWHAQDAPVEIGRVVSLASAALFSMNAEKPREHIYIAGTDRLATVIVGRLPLRHHDIAGLTDASDRLGFSILASPATPSTVPVLGDLLAADSSLDLERRGLGYSLDVSAPTDARPFFFNQLRIAHPEDMVFSLRRAFRGGAAKGASLVVAGNVIALSTLLLLIVLSAVLVTAVIVWPARASASMIPPEVARAGTAYFFLIGLGFMLIEIAFTQRISIFLGHPIYALGVVLFSIIVSTGLGSFLSGVVELKSLGQFTIWLVALGTYVITLPLWLSSIFLATQAEGIFIRAAVSVGLVAPAGLLMGYGFPNGMRFVDALASRATPWFWGINGAAGVLGSGLAVLVSLAFSIHWTLVAGGVCYLILLLPLSVLLKLTNMRVPARHRIVSTAPAQA
jgi:hypothetical protein